MKTPMLRGLLPLVLLLLPLLSLAQRTPVQVEETKRKILAHPEVAAVHISPETQSPTLIRLKVKSAEFTKDEARPALENFLELRKGTDLLKPEKNVRHDNIEVQEFQQFFKGVKVDRARYKALLNSGYVSFFSGTWYHVPASLSTTPSITMSQALNYARRHVGAGKWAEDEIKEKINSTSDPKIRQELQKELADAGSKGELVIIEDFTKEGVAEMKLAFKFNIYATQPLSRAWVYVDAHTGKILLYDPIIKHAGTPTSVSTTVKTRYAGNKTIKTKQISGLDPNSGAVIVSSHPSTEVYVPGSSTWVLIDDTRGKGIETYDMNGVGGLPLSIPSLYIQGKSFTDVDNFWSLSEHKRSDPLQNGTGEGGALELENDDIAWDAHWGAATVYDYWLSRHSRKSFDGNDGKIKSFIHYGPAYDNAFWNGSVMTYGDGSGSTTGFKALTSLDICGHEIGHGVCSYTSDLVYQKESGALNEALSDIWAACVERFAVQTVDPSLASVYRPFYVGEQIGPSPDQPLRRMDNPKFASDPDTYGGQFWRNPNCSPALTNDYCGVHTNSGVLNKWFYLITVGSHAGSGPDAQFARPDSDDGINDKGNAYSVNGLGFAVTEKIVYLMELMLSSTATYADAREAAIAAATVVSGDACSPIVESVVNAWYAVGVGDRFNPAGCVSTYGFVFQPGVTTSEGASVAGCDGEHELKVKLLLPPNSTASVTSSGTATGSLDYRIPVTTVSNALSTNAITEISVFVKNDAVIEPDETINLSVAVTNTGTSPVNTSYAIRVVEDDLVPVIGSGSTPLAGDAFEGIPNGYNLPAGWSILTETVGDNKWGVWDGALKVTATVEGVQQPAGTYNNLSPTSTIAFAPLVDARGFANVNIRFDFRVQGEVDINGLNPENFGVYDYMAIVYSFDGVNFTELNLTADGFGPFCSLTPTGGTFEMALPKFLTNKQFYIGFKWFNDTNAGGPESVSIDNVSVTGESKTIEGDLNHNSREIVAAGQEVSFYSIQDGQVLGKVKNNSAKNFGCTNMYVEKSGNASFNLYYGNDGLQKVSDKIVRVEPSLIYKASTTLSFYFTEAQLSALEQATNRPRSQFLVYHVDGASYSAAAQNTTRKYTPVYTAIAGAGGMFTITMNDRPIGSFALGCTVSTFGTKEPIATSGALRQLKSGLYPNPASNTTFLSITTATEQKVRIDIVNIAGQVVHSQSQQLREGTARILLNTGALSKGTYMVRTINAEGNLLLAHSLVKQ